MSDLSRLADTIAGMSGGGARILAAHTAAAVGEASVNGAVVRPGRWINRPPAGAGHPVLLLLQDGMCTAIGEGGAGGTPPGVVMQWAGTHDTVPPGWLLCAGASVSRTTYAALFAVIGTTYGIGDGSTTFTLPDFRTRVLAGYTSSDTDFNALGKRGGAKTHTLTVNEMPSHNHAWDGNVTAAANYAGSGGFQGSQTTQRASLLPTGGGGAHNNLQPYAVINHIIKA